MEALFLKLLNMSISAGWLILAVVVLRWVLKKVPKALHCVLWGLVGLRLLCPFSIESVLSLVPSAETVPGAILYAQEPAIQTGIDALNQAVNPAISQALAPQVGASANPVQIITGAAAHIWLLGMVCLLLYAAVSYLRLRRRVMLSVPLREVLWICDQVDSPFILGLFRPRIYLPSGMEEGQITYVAAHEKAHLKHRDHWWKPLGFLLLAVYWFNPLVWLAYVLLCRDIELACDERVIRDMGAEGKRAYSEALLACSAPQRMIAACPLAFGEVGVKERVRSVMNYKKPAFWAVIAAAAAAVVLAVCFLTDPLGEPGELPRWFESDEAVLGYILEHVEIDGEKVVGGTYLETGVEGGGAGYKKFRVRTAGGGEYDLTASGRYYRQLLITGPYGPGLRVTDIICVPTGSPGGTGAAPVPWLYAPQASAAQNNAFHFSFDFEYTHIDVSCDAGELWQDFRVAAEDQARGKTLRFEADTPVRWRPIEAEGGGTAAEAGVDFTVYDGDRALYSGAFEIVRTAEGENTAMAAYEARLVDCEGLVLRDAETNFGALVVPAAGTDTAESGDSAPSVAGTPLTPEEIEEANAHLEPLVWDRQGNLIGINPLSCFFTSYYDRVEDLNLTEFLTYFPNGSELTDPAEFKALKELEGWPFGTDAALETMLVPVHKYTVESIDTILSGHAGVTTADLTDVAAGNTPLYLEGYDAYYNFTSDAGYGTFYCTRGEREGDVVRLYEETEHGTDLLTLRKVNDAIYHIVSHQRIEENVTSS